jgi:hypothetical protein
MTLLVLFVVLLAVGYLEIVLITTQQDAHRQAGLLPARGTRPVNRRR